MTIIDFDEARSRLQAALRRARAGPVLAGPLVAADAALVTAVPEWVTELGIVADPDGYWILVSRGAGAAPEAGAATASPAQFVLNIDAGRYFVDTLDAATGEWISRESAPGGRLVAGLVCPGDAAIVRIRRSQPH